MTFNASSPRYLRQWLSSQRRLTKYHLGKRPRVFRSDTARPHEWFPFSGPLSGQLQVPCAMPSTSQAVGTLVVSGHCGCAIVPNLQPKHCFPPTRSVATMRPVFRGVTRNADSHLGSSPESPPNLDKPQMWVQPSRYGDSWIVLDVLDLPKGLVLVKGLCCEPPQRMCRTLRDDGLVCFDLFAGVWLR